MSEESILRLNVSETKKRFSDLLGRVAYGKETILITRRGRPMAKLVPIDAPQPAHPADVAGWLDADDPFFAEIDAVVAARGRHRPRVLEEPTDRRAGSSRPG